MRGSAEPAEIAEKSITQRSQRCRDFGSWSICVQWTLPLPRRIGEGSND